MSLAVCYSKSTENLGQSICSRSPCRIFSQKTIKRLAATSFGKLTIDTHVFKLWDNFCSIRTQKNSAVLQAGTEGQIELVQTLLKSGADINARDSLGSTLLIKAIYHPELVKILVCEKDIQIDAVDEQGESALMLAAHFGLEKTAKILLDVGADFFLTNKTGYSVDQLTDCPIIHEQLRVKIQDYQRTLYLNSLSKVLHSKPVHYIVTSQKIAGRICTIIESDE